MSYSTQQNDAILGPFAELLGVPLWVLRMADFVSSGDRIELPARRGSLRWRVWQKDSGAAIVDEHDPLAPIAADEIASGPQIILTDDPGIFAITRVLGQFCGDDKLVRAVLIPTKGKVLPSPLQISEVLAPVIVSQSSRCIVLSHGKTLASRLRHCDALPDLFTLPAAALARFMAAIGAEGQAMPEPAYLLGLLAAATELKAARAEPADDAKPAAAADPRPMIPYLPGARNAFAASIAAEMAGTGRFFRQGSDSVEVRDGALVPLSREAMPTRFEEVARVADAMGNPVDLNRDQAALITASSGFALPPIKILTSWPCLRGRGGQLEALTSYDPETGIFPAGKCELVPLAEAVASLRDLLSEFCFGSPTDEARAFAALLTPALCNSDLIGGGRVPITIVEANASQSGKGLIAKLISAVYGQKIATYNKHPGKGLGSTKESFDNHVLAGRPFISMDNVRGRIDEEYLESFLTEDRYDARRMRDNPIGIDPTRFCLFVTTNQAEMTEDLANRCNIIKIHKAPAGTLFRRGPGELIELVRTRQPYFFGCVAALMREWVAQGRPRSSLISRDANFAAWGRAADWICSQLLGCSSSIDAGFQESKERLSDSRFVDFRRMLLAAQRQGCKSSHYTTSHFFQILLEDGEIKVGKEHPSERNREDMLPAIGRWLAPIFRRYGEEITVDGILIRRELAPDGSKAYLILFPEAAAPVAPAANHPTPPAAPLVSAPAAPAAAATSPPARSAPYAKPIYDPWDDPPPPDPRPPPQWFDSPDPSDCF